MQPFQRKKEKVLFSIVFVLLALVLLPVSPALAANCTSQAVSGNWSTAGTWSCGHAPLAGDDVVISNGNVITLDITPGFAINSLSVADGGTNSSLTIAGTNSLTVTTDVNIVNTNTGVTKSVDVGAGSLTINGNLNLSEGSGGTRRAQATISTGTVTVAGNITYNAGGTATLASIIFTGAGTLNVAGNYLSGTTLTTVAGSKVNFNGATQTIPGYAYNILSLSGSGTKTMPAAFAANPASLIMTGTASATTAGNLTITGALNVGNGTTLNTGTNFTLSVGGASTINGTLNLGGTGTKTFTGDVTIGATGTWNESGVSAINDAGSLTNNGVYTANTGTHTFSGAAKIITPTNLITIPTLVLSGTTTITGGILNVTTSLAVSAATTSSASGMIITPILSTTAGLTNNGAISAGTMTVGTTALTNTVTGTINATNSLTIGAASTNAGTITTPTLTVNSATTNSGTMNVSTTLTGTNSLTNSGTLNFGGTTLAVAGLTTNAVNSVVNYNGSGVQTVRAVTYDTLILSGSVLKTMASNAIIVNKVLNITGSAVANLTANTGTIYSLALGGVGQSGIGTWGTTASGATFKNDLYFASNGWLNTVTHNDAKQAAVLSIDAMPAQTFLGGTFIVTGHTTNTDTASLLYSVVSGPCVLVSGATFNPTGVGTCVVQAYGAATANFEAGYSTQSITINAASQAALTVSSTPARVVQGYTATLSSSGGSGTGLVTYSTGSSTGCNVVGNVLTVTDATGSCDVTATNAGDAQYSPITSAPLAIIMTPFQVEVNKSFLPTNILPGRTSTLSITLYNQNAFDLINAAWSDNLIGAQPGMSIANPPAVADSPLGCSNGSVTAVAGGTTISMSNGTVPAKSGGVNGQCTVTVNVTSTTAGNLIDTIPAGTVTANQSGGSGGLATNLTPASATLQVTTIIPPTVDKNFNLNTIYAGANSTLTININNQDPSSQLTNLSMTDILPGNVVIASPSTTTMTTCNNSSAPVLSAVAGTNTLTINNASIAAGVGRKCTITVLVTSAVQGSYNDNIPGGTIQTAEGVTNAQAAAATLNVQQLNITKSFAPITIPAGGVSTATITIFNPTSTAYTGINLTDNLPAGMTVSGTPASPQCIGGSVTSTANTVTITGGSTLSGGTPASPKTCVLTFNVTVPLTQNTTPLTNTIPAGSLSDTQGISNPATVSANLNITYALSVTKSFSPNPITVNNPSTVTITIFNNSGFQATGVSMTDTLVPAGLVIYGTPTTPQCNGGTVAYNGGPPRTVTLTNGTINTGSNCTVTFQVTSASAGTYGNSITAGGVCGTLNSTSVCNVNGSGNVNLTVALSALPVVGSKSFSNPNIAPGGTSALTINITAPSDSALHNVSVTDVLPVGVTTTNAVTKNVNCQNGTLSPGIGLNTISWTGTPGTLSINANTLCILTVTITSSTPGFVTNTISTLQVSNDEGRPLQSAFSANLNVSNFTIGKAFYPPTINQNGLSVLTITLTNQNLIPLTNLSLSDSLPGGVIDATPSNANTDCGGTLTAVGGAGAITLVNAGVPAKVGVVNGVCAINVTVKGTGAAGTYGNSIRVAPEDVSAYLGPALIYPLAAASANLIIAPLTITVNKSFDDLTVFGGSSSTMRIRLSNPNNAILSGISLTDTMPAGMYIAFPANLNAGSCGGTLVGVPGANTFSYSGGTLPVGPSFCELTLSITMNVNGNLTNPIPIGAVTTFNGASNPAAAQATLTNLGGASVHKAFFPATIPLGSASTMTLIIQNTSNFALTNVGGSMVVGGVPNVLDQLPAGLVIASNTSVNNCGGSLTATAGTDIIGLASGNVPEFSSCTITVPVTSITAACYTNTIPVGALRNNEGVSNGAVGQDTLCILGAPTIATTPNPGSMVIGSGARLQDSATLTGGTAPTGSVTFKLFGPTDLTCSGTPIFTETRTVTAGFTSATTTGFIANTAGIWHWLATYSGDANNSPASSLCADEAVTISKASPVITTNANPATGTVGTNIPAAGDSVTSMGSAFNPTGSITFTLFSDPTCNTAVPTMSGSGVILGGVASRTFAWTPTVPGTYYWQATYPGDANNNSATSVCGAANEQIVVGKASPVLTTTALGTAAIGNNINDVAHLTGGYGVLGGTISFTVYAPGDATCTSPIAVGSAQSVSGVGDYTSANFTTSALGSYRWRASYSGDANNAAVSTACNNAGETSSAIKATPILTTAASGPVSVGAGITDNAHLTGVFGSLAGTIDFSVFAPGDTTCTMALSPVPASAAVSGSGNYPSGTYATTVVGDYRWEAFYSGDAYNDAVSTSCNDSGEISTANDLENPVLTTTASAPVAVGGSITDTAHLSGSATPLTGTISFDLYASTDDTCSLAAIAVTPPITISGAGDYESNAYTAITAGSYRWRAFYSGDANYNEVSTSCYDAAETSVVNKATPTLTTTASGPVTVGGVITDIAHLTGGYGTLGGSISFNVFAPGDTTCSSPTAVNPAVAVSGTGNYTSASFTTIAAGTYRWVATYAGDANNNAVSTACNDAGESSVANLATPTLTTTASGPATVGGNITDTAHLVGGFGTLGGTMSFYAYAPSDTSCITAISVTPSVAVSGVGNYTSANYTTSAVGAYRWRATYSGDGNNNPVSTACNDAGESSTLNKATPTLTTSASGPVTVGANITDTAHLSGGFGTLGGSISFLIYAPGDVSCITATAINPAVMVSGAGDYTSNIFTTLATGSYRWRAFYGGDTNNFAVSTACNDAGETSTSNVATPILTTTASGPVTVGGTILDTAHLSGGFGSLGGNITFKVYAPGDVFCFTPTSVGPPVPVNGANDYPSSNFTTLASGTYRWRAFYSGDSNNDLVSTACNESGESSNTGKANPTITTNASPSTGTVGASITAGDSETSMAGGYSPTGSITFTLYSDSQCLNTVPGMSGSGAISGGTASWSTSWTPIAAGTYYWRAFYGGDANNNSATTSCGASNEEIVIGKTSPTLTTQLKLVSDNSNLVNPVIVGTGLYDTAAISGGINAGGTITYKIYSDNMCSTEFQDVTPVSNTVVAGVVPNSANQIITPAGDYWYQASYSGDTNNNGATSDCSSEPASLTKATPGINTSASAGGVVGVTLNDTAVLSGGYNPTGAVTFNLFPPSDPTCSSTPAYTDSEASAPYATSPGYDSDATGTWHWTAAYSGDANNAAVSSGCAAEAVPVNQATPTLTTTASGPVIVGSAIHDTAHLGGGYAPAGTISFQVFAPNDASCSTPILVNPPDSVGSAGDYSSASYLAAVSGGYRWTATYSGDTNNASVSTACNDPGESSMVFSPSLAAIKSLDSVTKVSAGTWDVTYSILVENTGNADLDALQVTDDLAMTFPAPTTFTVESISSTDFSRNPAFDGNGDTNLLTAVDSLTVGGQGTITVTVRVVPTEAGPFNNFVVASAQPPLGNPISTQSPPVPVSFGPRLFDPPSGAKTVNASGLPNLKWSLVWINDTNVVGVNAVAHDPIPAGTTFKDDGVYSGFPLPGGILPPGSTPTGVSCTAGTSTLTTTTLCYYEGPTIVNPRGEIIWAGTLGPDPGVTDPALAVNAIHIVFSVTAAGGVTSVGNVATIDSDLNGNGTTTDSGEQNVARAAASWSSTPTVLPSTGFAPGRVTSLPSKTVTYTSLGDLWLEIPRLGVKMPIVGIPQTADGSWDVSWLGDDAGWLNGTAYPTRSGNSVLTGHVWNADNTPGPFRFINTLWYGDQVIVHASGAQYIYVVREVLQVGPGSVSTMLKHEDLPWLTLVTCGGYDEINGLYKYRVLVRAVLFSVK